MQVRSRRGDRGALAAAAVATALAFATLLATSTTSATAAVARTSPTLGSLTTYDYNNLRTGQDTVDPSIGHLSTGPIWDDTLDGAMYAEPLVYDGVTYAATENDSVYALNARTGKVLWRQHVGTPVPTSVIDVAPTLGPGCGDISPLGITGTPVIDAGTHEIFAAEETFVDGTHWQNIQHWLVAISLATHKVLWRRRIDPPHPNDPNVYYVAAQQQRPALTLVHGRIYVEFGGLAGDCGTYHGYVVDLPDTGKGGLVTYQVPTQREGAIWGTSGGFISAKGNLYVATGNGSSNTIAHFDEGNAVVELSPTLKRLGVWAPSNWVQLNDDDWDLGSTNPIAVPDTSLLFVAGKPATNGDFGYLMADSPLEGVGKGAYTGAVCPGGGDFGADASYVSGAGAGAHIYVYAACGSGTEALLIHPTAPFSFHQAWGATGASPNGPPIVAGGFVWALNTGSSQLDGLNLTTGVDVFSRSTDALDHFATPGVGDGAIFVPTATGVEAFGVSK